MFSTILAFMTWDFIGSIILFICLVWSADDEKNILSTVFLICACIYVYFRHKEIYEYLFSNPINILLFIIVYFIIGFLWSLLKHRLYLEKVKEDVIKTANTYYDIDDKESINKIENDFRFNIDKSKIIFWISYWPTSMIWTFLSNWLTGFGTLIYQKTLGIYENMSTSVANKTVEEFNKKRTLRTTR